MAIAHRLPTPEPEDDPIPDREPAPEDDPVPHPDPVTDAPARCDEADMLRSASPAHHH